MKNSNSKNFSKSSSIKALMKAIANEPNTLQNNNSLPKLERSHKWINSTKFQKSNLIEQLEEFKEQKAPEPSKFKIGSGSDKKRQSSKTETNFKIQISQDETPIKTENQDYEMLIAKDKSLTETYGGSRINMGNQIHVQTSQVKVVSRFRPLNIVEKVIIS